jgi:hypothetical protein
MCVFFCAAYGQQQPAAPAYVSLPLTSLPFLAINLMALNSYPAAPYRAPGLGPHVVTNPVCTLTAQHFRTINPFANAFSNQNSKTCPHIPSPYSSTNHVRCFRPPRRTSKAQTFSSKTCSFPRILSRRCKANVAAAASQTMPLQAVQHHRG